MLLMSLAYEVRAALSPPFVAGAQDTCRLPALLPIFRSTDTWIDAKKWQTREYALPLSIAPRGAPLQCRVNLNSGRHVVQNPPFIFNFDGFSDQGRAGRSHSVVNLIEKK